MSRIKQVIRLLNELKIAKYEIKEHTNNNYEQYYVKGNLETLRNIQTVETKVILYKEILIDDKKYLGNADFTISKNISKKELTELVNNTLSKATLVHNEPYELTSCDKKKTFFYKDSLEEPMVILQKIATIFNNETTDTLKFNALECFFNEKTLEIVNSNNLHLKKKTYEIKVEAIPSYYSKDFKTELYRMFIYDSLNYDKIKEDAKLALYDCDNRGKAVKIENVNKCNVILRSQHIRELFDELVYDYSYGSVYHHMNLKSIGEALQDHPKDYITLSLDKKNKADFFDSDGVILNKHPLIEKGKLINYHGSNRFAQYLNLTPSGNLSKIVLKKGSKSIDDLKKEPYIEIIDLSGIQIDTFADYVGGEVRLAIYFDGEKLTPISGFSFSTNISSALNTMRLSKEVDNINNYEGPKYMRFENVDIL